MAERVSVFTPVSAQTWLSAFSLKMWYSPRTGSHMSAHQKPSFTHSWLSGRFMPVGLPVPLVDPSRYPTSAPAPAGRGTT